MKISRNSVLRRLIMPLLRITAIDMTIRHPHVRKVRISLNSFMHKGYWFHRKLREKNSMYLFSRLIKPGNQVVEVGGHIGFISIYFAHLLGAGGRLTVFEPGANNLPYVRRNIKAALALGPEIKLIEKAVGDRVGEVVFFEESLTGQNNSAVADFEGLKRNANFAFTTVSTSKTFVPMTTLDNEINGIVDFIKVDVEGFEKFVLLGAKELIERCKPALMVEIQADEVDIFNFFSDRGFLMFSENGLSLMSPPELRGNVFVLHSVAHANALESIFDHIQSIEVK